MFYPVDSLKRGGRFYLCWVADSWPLRFAAITHRQLWQHDIRKLCDDLLEVMTNESGRPANRFSLRLSSQLMRGLVRLYERKVTVLLGDLCMINAHVFKSTNKKFVAIEVRNRPLRPLPQAAPVQLPEEEAEQRVEELIQNSGNVVANIQDITLKEAVIPEFQLPPNDNFGEENPEQALQSLLADRTIEQMMLAGPSTSAIHTSGLDLVEKSHEIQDRSRDVQQLQMEAVAELDVTLFGKTTTEDIPAFEKDLSAIDIPEIPIPVPVPEPDPQLPMEILEPQQEIIEQRQETEQQQKEAEQNQEEEQVREQQQEQVVQQPAEEELEELEGLPQPKRRRLKPKLIVDKKIKLGSDFLRARVDNPSVELRCEDFTDDIVTICTPMTMLLRRPTAAGHKIRTALTDVLQAMYQRRLGATPGNAKERMELNLEVEEPRQQRRTRSTTEKNVETEQSEVQEVPVIQPAELETATIREELLNVTTDIPNLTTEIPNLTTDGLNVTTEGPNVTTEGPNVTAEGPNVTAEGPNVTAEGPNVTAENITDVQNVQELNQLDITDLPTQKLETLSQVGRKRTGEHIESPPKRIKSLGQVSFRESQQQKELNVPTIDVTEPDKENIPPNFPERLTATQRSQVDVSVMLQEAGLADIQPIQPASQVQVDAQRRREDSDGSETPLGSLDRTKVSLGDSVQTTDSHRFIRNEWGIEGTMVKIMHLVKSDSDVITVHTLVRRGPTMPGYMAFIAARCFQSILRLKQHGFIRIEKDPETLEITDITLGPKFDNISLSSK